MTTRPALGELARLAREATPGPWCTDERYPGCVYCDDVLGSLVADCHGKYTVLVSLEQEARNAAFIAACSPDVVLQLVALATGGAEGGQEQDLEKTEKNQQLEPNLKGEG